MAESILQRNHRMYTEARDELDAFIGKYDKYLTESDRWQLSVIVGKLSGRVQATKRQMVFAIQNELRRQAEEE